MKYGTHKLRHELKYNISTADYYELRARAAAFMQRDRHGEDGKYFIRSLYLDDIFCSDYHQKMDGWSRRRKYRIRVYDLSDEVIKFEVKDKYDSYISKVSSRITRGQYRKIADGDFSFVSDMLFDNTDKGRHKALRIGYMVLPPLLLAQLRADRTGCGVPTLEQYTLREFMRQGYFEKHVNRMRMCYRSRRRELIELLRPYSERLHPVGAQAGTYLLVRVDSAPDDLALCAKALEVGVRVWPISPCFMGPVPEEYRAAVLLGYGNLSSGQMRRGVELLAKAWSL